MKNVYGWASLALFSLAFLVVLVTFRDYGLSWDENIQHRYGERIVHYYETGGRDRRALHYINLYYYGGLFETACVLAGRLAPLEVHETRHLLNALVGLAAILGAWQVGRLLGGPRTGFFSALLLLLAPRFYGEIFFNPKDVPFAAGYVWSVYGLLRVLPELPRPSVGSLARLGVAVGLTLAVRVGGLVLLAYLALVLGLALVRAACETRNPRATARLALRLATSLIFVWIVAYAVMLPFWPWAQVNPLTRPFAALREMSHFSGWTMGLTFDGAAFEWNEIPRRYLPVLLLLTTPEGVLALLATGALLGGWAMRSRQARATLAARRHLLVLLAALLPIAYVVGAGSLVYNGVRHVLFVLPMFVALAASALDHGLRRLASRSRFAARLALAAFCGYLLVHLSVTVRLHPYQYVYYNQLAGGLPGAAGRFELDYWGTTFREAVIRLRELVEREAGGHRPPDYRLLVGSNPYTSTTFFPEYFSPVTRAEEADFVIEAAGFEVAPELGGRPVIAVKRLGVELGRVRDRRAQTRTAPPGSP